MPAVGGSREPLPCEALDQLGDGRTFRRGCHGEALPELSSRRTLVVDQGIGSVRQMQHVAVRSSRSLRGVL